jgi:segregation and condensation protein A
MQRVHELLATEQRAAMSALFECGMHKTTMLGVFLAILELVRHHSLRAEQPCEHGEIWLLPGREFRADRRFDQLGDGESPPEEPTR